MTNYLDLKTLLNSNKITIRDLAAHMGVTLKRIRAIRDFQVKVDPLVRADYLQAIAELRDRRDRNGGACIRFDVASDERRRVLRHVGWSRHMDAERLLAKVKR